MSDRLPARIKGYVDKRTSISYNDLVRAMVDHQAGVTGASIDRALHKLQVDGDLDMRNGVITSLGIRIDG